MCAHFPRLNCETKMRLTISPEELTKFVVKQINHHYPDERPVKSDNIKFILNNVLQKLEFNFKHVKNKYFEDNGLVYFDHLHGDQYSMFLYLLSREAFLIGNNIDLAKKIYLLNKAMFGLDVFYEVELPSIFLFVHPVGTVLGRAKYSDYLVVYQRVGVGSNHGIYPTIGEYATLHPGASVLGNSRVGSNCTIGTESLVLDKDIPSNSLYLGTPKDYLVKGHNDLRYDFWKE